MNRRVIIAISAIMAITLILTGVVVHHNNNKNQEEDAASIHMDSETLLAPPAGWNDTQITEFYHTNATQDEYVSYDEDGKEIVEEQLGSCPRITTRVTTDRLGCYLTISRSCRFPCRTIVWTVGVTSDYRLKYQCQCV